jgi:hypothetical protein
MSTNSYSLSNDGSHWIAEGQLASGRAIRFTCAPASSTKEAADAVAALKWAQRLQQSAASKSRWAKHAANGAPASSTPASPAAADRNAQIRARLVSVGDSKPLDDDDDDDDGDDDDPTDPGAKGPIDPDSVHDSPEDAKRVDADDDEDAGDDDGEAAEVLADVIGTGIYNGLIVGGTTKLLKRAKPPKRPGEPHELFVRYGQEGLCYRVRKLIGKDAKLGPNGKLAVGLAGTIVMMLWNAEDLEPEAAPAQERPAAAAPATPAPAPAKAAAAAAAPAGAPDQKPRTELRLVRRPAAPATPATPAEEDNPLGRFR